MIRKRKPISDAQRQARYRASKGLVGLNLPLDLRNRIKGIAEQLGISQSEVIEKALQALCEDLGLAE